MKNKQLTASAIILYSMIIVIAEVCGWQDKWLSGIWRRAIPEPERENLKLAYRVAESVGQAGAKIA